MAALIALLFVWFYFLFQFWLWLLMAGCFANKSKCVRLVQRCTNIRVFYHEACWLLAKLGRPSVKDHTLSFFRQGFKYGRLDAEAMTLGVNDITSFIHWVAAYGRPVCFCCHTNTNKAWLCALQKQVERVTMRSAASQCNETINKPSAQEVIL